MVEDRRENYGGNHSHSPNGGYHMTLKYEQIPVLTFITNTNAVSSANTGNQKTGNTELFSQLAVTCIFLIIMAEGFRSKDQF